MGADCDQGFENFLKYCDYMVFEDKTLVFAHMWAFLIAPQKSDMISSSFYNAIFNQNTNICT